LENEGLIVGWMRDDSRLGDSLRVVAIDRKTFQARWVSRTITGIPGGASPRKDVLHLAFVPPSWIVATDARGYAIVLRERDGVELVRHFIGEGGVEETCAVVVGGTPQPTTNNSQALLLLALDARYWRPRFPGDVGQTLNPVEKHRQKTSLLDVEHGLLKPAPLTARCPRPFNECSAPQSDKAACRLAHPPEISPPTSLSSDGATTWNEGDHRVSIGQTLDGVSLLSAVGSTTKNNTWLWTAAIPTPANPQRRGSPSLATVKDHVLYALYQTERGPWRLVAIDVPTGARSYETDVPLSDTGTRVQSLSVDHNEIFLAMNDELYVLDSKSGEVQRRINVRPGEAEAPSP
jgi:hypothetical protein